MQAREYAQGFYLSLNSRQVKGAFEGVEIRRVKQWRLL
jgi:hypothetical protein